MTEATSQDAYLLAKQAEEAVTMMRTQVARLEQRIAVLEKKDYERVGE